MGIARRRLDVAVAEQFPDHRQGFAECQRSGRESVPEVVHTDILQPGLGPHVEPEMLFGVQF